MTTPTGKTHCVKCDKPKSTSKCAGCLQDFCFKHLGDHRQELNKQLEDIEVKRDLFRQTLSEQIKDPIIHPTIQEINKWERDAIDKIQKTAEGAREVFVKHVTEYINRIEMKLNQLTNQLKQTREEEDFNEINMGQFEEELTQMTEELTKPPDIAVRQDSSSFINNIYVDVSGCESVPACSSSTTPKTTADYVAFKPIVTAEVQTRVNTENIQKMVASMIVQFEGTTHQQIDEYSRRRTELISEEVTAAINRIVAETQVQQQTLLTGVKTRSALIEEKYEHKLLEYVKELSELENDFNLRQELILEEARKRIDNLSEEANRLKSGTLRDVNAKVETSSKTSRWFGPRRC